ncbi:MAG: type II toxin-antitoxin system HipA family toxin [Candidatus Methanoplasma sp.]|jgi:serine/threonine-protein kinase HipA|nr:type II toxin-antitoxin system HipA family toxin [Candidatus Methanoplasma sp.]
MNIKVQVRLWGENIGTASWNEQGRYARFQYDKDFIRSGLETSPLVMPLSSDTYSFKGLNRDTYMGLPGMLADSLPDKWGNIMISEWMAVNSISPADVTPLDRLCYTGKRGMGALEYEPMMDRDKGNGKVDVDRLAGLAAKILDEREGFSTDPDTDGMKDLISLGSSAGGARAKAVMAYDGSTGEIRSGQVSLPEGSSHWLIKLDTETKEKKIGYCRTEYAYWRMATACGINMTECRLLETAYGTHFMTKRFDREGSDKIHMQTLCGLAHMDFKIPGAYSYEDLFRIMRILQMPYSDQTEMFRRAVFNVIAWNCDDHTKNISFLMQKDGEWRLAPAYDMTFAHDPRNYWIKNHQMSIGGKTEGIGTDDLRELAEKAGIRESSNIIKDVKTTVSEWKRFADDSGVPESTADRIGKELEGNP